MNVACVMAAQYDDIIYMNIWYEQRPQKALFNCSFSYIVRKYLRIEKMSLQGFTEASSVFTWNVWQRSWPAVFNVDNKKTESNLKFVIHNCTFAMT